MAGLTEVSSFAKDNEDTGAELEVTFFAERYSDP